MSKPRTGRQWYRRTSLGALSATMAILLSACSPPQTADAAAPEFLTVQAAVRSVGAETGPDPANVEIGRQVVQTITQFTGTRLLRYSDGSTDFDQLYIENFCNAFFVRMSPGKAILASAGHCNDPVRAEAELNQDPLAQSGAMKDGSSSSGDYAGPNSSGYPKLVGADPVQGVTSVVIGLPTGDPNPVFKQRTTLRVISVLPFEQGDVSLLAWDNPTADVPVLEVSPTEPKVHDTVSLIGVSVADIRASMPPHYGNYPVSSIVDNAPPQSPSYNDGTLSKTDFAISTGGTFYKSNANLESGMSGGPAVNMTTGEVIGINSFSLADEEIIADADGFATSYSDYPASSGSFVSSSSVLNEALAAITDSGPSPAPSGPSSNEILNTSDTTTTTGDTMDDPLLWPYFWTTMALVLMFGLFFGTILGAFLYRAFTGRNRRYAENQTVRPDQPAQPSQNRQAAANSETEAIRRNPPAARQ